MDETEYGLVLSFYIDTPGYSDRDRAMFVAGFEFCMVMELIDSGWTGSRPVHRENESRIRMALAKKQVHCELIQHEGYEGCETWSDLTVTENRLTKAVEPGTHP